MLRKINLLDTQLVDHRIRANDCPINSFCIIEHIYTGMVQECGYCEQILSENKKMIINCSYPNSLDFIKND